MEIIQKDIQDAIQKNLPAQVGETLRAELNELNLLRVTSKEYIAELETLREENSELRSLNLRLDQVEGREKEVFGKELMLENKTLKAELSEQFYHKQRQDNIELVRAVFQRDLVALSHRSNSFHSDGSSATINPVAVNLDEETSRDL